MNNIITIFIIVPLLAFLLLGLNWLLSDNRPYNSKLITYECGYDTIPLQTRSPYEVQIWTVGLFFLAFDLELVSIYPAALIFSDMDYYGFIIFLIFNNLLLLQKRVHYLKILILNLLFYYILIYYLNLLY